MEKMQHKYPTVGGFKSMNSNLIKFYIPIENNYFRVYKMSSSKLTVNFDSIDQISCATENK